MFCFCSIIFLRGLDVFAIIIIIMVEVILPTGVVCMLNEKMVVFQRQRLERCKIDALVGQVLKLAAHKVDNTSPPRQCIALKVPNIFEVKIQPILYVNELPNHSFREFQGSMCLSRSSRAG